MFVRHQKEIKFLNLVQGNRSAAANEVKFTELARFTLHIITDESTRARKFLQGLRPSICTRLAPFLFTQYFDIVNWAFVVSRILKTFGRCNEERSILDPTKPQKDETLVEIFKGITQRVP